MTSKPLYNVRPIKNLKDMLEQSTKLFGSRDAFFLKGSDGNYRGVKYTDFKTDVDALGTALINLGLKDKFIAVIGENRYEWCVSYLAVTNGTGVVVPLDKELPQSEIENLLVRSNACAVIFSGKLDKEIKKVFATTSSVKYFISMDLQEDEQGFLSLRKLMAKGKEMLQSGNRSFLDAEIDANRMTALLFTSGTTDLAKGVMLSHKNICSNVVAVCQSLFIDCNDSALSILPIHHTYECTAGFLVPIYNGCRIAFCEGLKHIPKNLKETQPTLLFLVPLILENMYKKIWDQARKKTGMTTKLKLGLRLSDFLINTFKIDLRRKLFNQIHEILGGKVRLVIAGAAAIEPEVSKGFRSMGINLLQGYGLTEHSPIAAVNREELLRNDSIGLPLPGVEIEIDSPNSEGIGELKIKSDSVMLGYYENGLATSKTIKNGWLYTGDLGCMNAEGFVFITGRKKNVIVTKNGKNIFPEEVEAYLNKSPYILESLVYGKLHDESGETDVEAQIVPDFEFIKEKLKVDNPSEQEIFNIINVEVKNINRSMPLYKHIKRFTIRTDEFAKTTTRKIKRYVEKTG